jgi:hypothetical protein
VTFPDENPATIPTIRYKENSSSGNMDGFD